MGESLNKSLDVEKFHTDKKAPQILLETSYDANNIDFKEKKKKQTKHTTTIDYVNDDLPFKYHHNCNGPQSAITGNLLSHSNFGSIVSFTSCSG